MAVQASVVLATARTLLNDDAATLWTDNVLLPKLAQAHRELQVLLRAAGAPIMKNTVVGQVNVGSTALVAQPTDLVEPIKLWEYDGSNYVLMTEYDPLPLVSPQAYLYYWQWVNEVITFIGATATKIVKLYYIRSLTVPTLNTDSVGFTNGELYLAPRVAALAAGSVGEQAKMEWATNLAKESIATVILTNRGRMPAAGGTVARP